MNSVGGVLVPSICEVLNACNRRLKPIMVTLVMLWCIPFPLNTDSGEGQKWKKSSHLSAHASPDTRTMTSLPEHSFLFCVNKLKASTLHSQEVMSFGYHRMGKNFPFFLTCTRLCRRLGGEAKLDLAQFKLLKLKYIEEYCRRQVPSAGWQQPCFTDGG